MLLCLLLQPKHTQTHTKTITIFLFLSFFLFEQTKQNHISFSFFLLVRTNKATQNTIFGFCVSTQTQKQPNEKERKKNNLPTCQKFASPWPRGGDQRRATARGDWCGGEQRLAVAHATSDGEVLVFVCTLCSNATSQSIKFVKDLSDERQIIG